FRGCQGAVAVEPRCNCARTKEEKGSKPEAPARDTVTPSLALRACVSLAGASGLCVSWLIVLNGRPAQLQHSRVELTAPRSISPKKTVGACVVPAALVESAAFAYPLHFSGSFLGSRAGGGLKRNPQGEESQR